MKRNGISVLYRDAAGVKHVAKGHSISFGDNKALVHDANGEILLVIPAPRVIRVSGVVYTGDEAGTRVRLTNASEGGGE